VSTELGEALERFEMVLRQYGVPAVRHLAAPLAADTVEATLAELGLPAHPDLVTWWGWHDGVPFDSREPSGLIISEYWPFSLARAVRWWRQTSDDDPDELDPPRELFPVAGWDNVASLRMHVGTGEVLVEGPHVYRDPPFSPEWPSLLSWVEDAIALYESGAIRLGDDGGFVAERAHWPPSVKAQVHW